MFNLKAVIAGVGVAMLVALAGETLYIHHQTKYTASIKQANVDLEAKIASAASVISYQNKVAVATNSVVNDVTQNVVANVQKKSVLSQEVAVIAKKEKDETISTDAADAAYFDSMWSAYCTSGSTNVHCTASTGRSVK